MRHTDTPELEYQRQDAVEDSTKLPTHTLSNVFFINLL